MRQVQSAWAPAGAYPLPGDKFRSQLTGLSPTWSFFFSFSPSFHGRNCSPFFFSVFSGYPCFSVLRFFSVFSWVRVTRKKHGPVETTQRDAPSENTPTRSGGPQLVVWMERALQTTSATLGIHRQTGFADKMRAYSNHPKRCTFEFVVWIERTGYRLVKQTDSSNIPRLPTG